MARNDWTRTPEAPLTFSRYCAPTALAGLLGCSRFDAAEMLLAEPHMVCRTLQGAVNGYNWQRFLVSLGGRLEWGRYTGEELAQREREYEASYQRRRAAFLRGERRRCPQRTNLRDLEHMTVAKYLRRHPTGKVVLSVAGHTLYAEDGQVVADTLRTKSMRRRVEWAVHFDA